MFGLGIICDRILGEILPPELQWLADVGCAGIDAATGNMAGAALLSMKALGSGARAAGSRGTAEGIGVASDVVDVAAKEMLSCGKSIIEKTLQAGLSAINGKLGIAEGGSLLKNIMVKAGGAATGATIGGIAGGKEGALAGAKSGGKALSIDPVKSIFGASGVVGGVLVGAAKNVGLKGYQKGLDLGSAAANLTVPAKALEAGLEKGKESLLKGVAVLAGKGAALGASVDAAINDAKRNTIRAALSGELAASIASVPASIEEAINTESLKNRLQSIMETGGNLGKTVLNATTLGTMHFNPDRELLKAGRLAIDTTSLASGIFEKLDGEFKEAVASAASH